MSNFEEQNNVNNPSLNDSFEDLFEDLFKESERVYSNDNEFQNFFDAFDKKKISKTKERLDLELKLDSETDYFSSKLIKLIVFIIFIANNPGRFSFNDDSFFAPFVRSEGNRMEVLVDKILDLFNFETELEESFRNTLDEVCADLIEEASDILPRNDENINKEQ
ncbi:MAG: hypothetical protein KatS3mg085_617 [Candidatus Dojkabacteria bacterium]|nr:MAG: hypothetical protein KatS3mg085_617 [Candidatus Dojkabacteria bacterium]